MLSHPFGPCHCRVSSINTPISCNSGNPVSPLNACQYRRLGFFRLTTWFEPLATERARRSFIVPCDGDPCSIFSGSNRNTYVWCPVHRFNLRRRICQNGTGVRKLPVNFYAERINPARFTVFISRNDSNYLTNRLKLFY